MLQYAALYGERSTAHEHQARKAFEHTLRTNQHVPQFWHAAIHFEERAGNDARVGELRWRMESALD